MPPFDDADLFDEAGYLRLYPGIAEAMMQGSIDTAWNHFFHHGRAEGRSPNDVDPAFYLAAYPDIARDLGRPATQEDAAPHFIMLGRARGYRPNARAPRPGNGAALPSPFGGLWTDQANALDLIQGRSDLGWIRGRDAAMLRIFALEGIVTLDRPNDQERIDGAALALDQAFTGRFPELRFMRAAPGDVTQADNTETWHPDLTEQSVVVLDPHMVSRAIRDLLLDQTVTDFLSLLFGAPPRLTASRGNLRDAAPPDRDVAWHAYTLPLCFVAVTFALEATETGPALAWPGSHRLPDLPWPGGHVTLSEAWRDNPSASRPPMAARETRVRALLHGQAPRRLIASSGTRMIRHPNLIHAAEPPEPPMQRRALTAWYCPSFVSPCAHEATPARTHTHLGTDYSSAVYPAMDPRD
jgi:hypothetical protein